MERPVSQLNPQKYPALPCLRDTARNFAEKLVISKSPDKPLIFLVVGEGYHPEYEATLQLLHTEVDRLNKDLFLDQKVLTFSNSWELQHHVQTSDACKRQLTVFESASLSTLEQLDLYSFALRNGLRLIVTVKQPLKKLAPSVPIIVRTVGSSALPEVFDSQGRLKRHKHDVYQMLTHGMTLMFPSDAPSPKLPDRRTFMETYLHLCNKADEPRDIVKIGQQVAAVALEEHAAWITSEHLERVIDHHTGIGDYELPPILAVSSCP